MLVIFLCSSFSVGPRLAVAFCGASKLLRMLYFENKHLLNIDQSNIATEK